jgi:hypothetical protein
MIEVSLKGGSVLSMPETLAEITVEQYCEFLQGASEFIAWQNKGIEEDAFIFDSAYQLDRLRRMMNMIADFCAPMPADHLFRMPAGDFQKSLLQSFGLDKIDDFDIDVTEGTLYTLWAHIYKVIMSIKFSADVDGLSFTWKGERFQVKSINKDRFTGLTLPPDLSVLEAVEVLELRRKTESLMTAGKHPAKNIQYEFLHRQLAILALKEGETLPDDDLELEKFCSERAAYFIGIDANTALQVDFFLGGQLGLLKNTLTVITFSIPQDLEALKMLRTE